MAPPDRDSGSGKPGAPPKSEPNPKVSLLNPGDSRNLTRTFRLERSGVVPSSAEPVTRFLSRRDLVSRGEEIRKRIDVAAPAEANAPAPPTETRAAVDESPVELPYLHRVPAWLRPSRTMRVQAAKAVFALVLLGVGGWLTLRPLPEAAVAAESTAAEAAPVAAPAVTAPPSALPAPPTPAAAVDRSATPRAAADAVAEGRYVQALALYRSLAVMEPNQPAYREAARIIEERLTPGR